MESKSFNGREEGQDSLSVEIIGYEDTHVCHSSNIEVLPYWPRALIPLARDMPLGKLVLRVLSNRINHIPPS